MGVDAFRRTSACVCRGHKNGGVGIGNRNAPDEAFLVLCLRFLPNWCQNVEHGKRAGDVKEQGPKSELFPRTNPAIELYRGVRTVVTR